MSPGSIASDPLLQPLQLRHLTLRNRIMSTSHEPAYSEDGKPKLRYQLYHEEKAKGGIALTMFGGSTNVAPDSPSVFGQLYAGDDSIIPYYQQMADRVHRHGACLMSQLTHMGRRTVWDDGNWLPTVAPSNVREPAHRSFPKEMEKSDIRRIVKAFGAAALRCQQGGLDGVEVIAYGHLVDQFWTPLVNQRTDEYGGDLDGRMRFSFEVFEEIRNQVGDDFIVWIRMSGDEDTAGGLTQEDCAQIAKKVVATGMIDFVNIAKGIIESDEALSHVIPGEGSPLGPHLRLAGAVKEVVDVPVFQAARITDLATARHAIEQGYVDMVGMTRAHMADPHIVRKLEAGEEDRIRSCVGASYCLSRLYLGQDALCIQNPATGREETIPHVLDRSPQAGRKVVVVGGGPAGLEAARASAERGHQVTLFEASDRLGGQVNLAARALERRAEIRGITEWLAAEIGHLGVEVRMNTLAEAADVKALEPDVVIVATGGWPNTSFLEAGEDLVSTTWDIIAGTVKPAATVLLYDEHGGYEALSCAENMARRGSQVEMVTLDRHVGQEVIGTTYPEYLKNLYEHGVVFTPDLRLKRVTRVEDGLVAHLYSEYTRAWITRTVDQVVVEYGTTPIADVYFDLLAESRNGGELDIPRYLAGEMQDLVTNPDGGFQLFRIGDAVSSRNIHAAIYDARRIAMGI